MASARGRKPPSPLDEERLEQLALRYVERFATTRAKLRTYLARKIRERGWAGAREPDLLELAEKFAGRGYVDDAAFALSKARSLSTRGYGGRRLTQTLRAAGVDAADAEEAGTYAEQEAVASALRFAEKRRLGPFAAAPTDRAQREKALAAMIRAGHDFQLARAVLAIAPGEAIDTEALGDCAGSR